MYKRKSEFSLYGQTGAFTKVKDDRQLYVSSEEITGKWYPRPRFRKSEDLRWLSVYLPRDNFCSNKSRNHVYTMRERDRQMVSLRIAAS